MRRNLILRPSRIENAGIGCFTVDTIPSHEPVIVGKSERLRTLSRVAIGETYLKYCIHKGGDNFLAPEDFLQMSVLWYVNHAKEPNLELHGNKLWTRRDISPEEELTLYYPDLLTHPVNQEWSTCEDI